VPAEPQRFGHDPDAVAEVLIRLVGRKLIDVPSPLEVRLNLQWGAHPSQFYRTREEMRELVVPFFRQGLKEDEACVWVGREPLSAEALPEANQIDCHDPDELSSDRLLQRALNQGYRGLRVAGDTRELRAIGQRRIKALCLYSAQRREPGEAEEVFARHEVAYVKRRDGWERIPASSARTVLESLNA
jgi:hypothetical protein